MNRDRLWPQSSSLQLALAEGRDDQLVMWVTLPSPHLVEILGAAGLDAIIVDREHTGFGMDTTESLIAACELAGMTPLVRPERCDPHEVTRLLDLGAAGIVFPMIGNGDDAAAARAMLAYPPHGTRGWGGRHIRRVRWSGPADQRSTAYLEAANAVVLSIFLIETPEGVERIDEILDRGRPDAVIFGWGDFGVTVGFDRARAMNAGRRVWDACRERGIGIGRDPSQPSTPAAYAGCFVVAGVDSLLVADALAAHVAELRAD